MRLVAWNLGHQTRERAIMPRFVEAVAAIAPDVLTLNEYVHGESRAPFLSDLARLGLTHVEVSSRAGKQNQVLVASRYPLVTGDLRGPDSADGHGASNFLHVRLRDMHQEIVGVRAPAYASTLHRDAYWMQLATTIRSTASRNIVYVGDFNADPDNVKCQGSRCLNAFRAEGWSVPSPLGDWSFHAGSRIDHVVASPNLKNLRAGYISLIDGIELASSNSTSRISDHAPLVVDFDEQSK